MEDNKKILLLGAGGHCTSVIDTLLSSYNYNAIGVIDRCHINNSDEISNHILNQPIIGSDDDLEFLLKNGYEYAFITVGSIGDTSIRKKLFHKILDLGFKIPNIIDNTSCVSVNVKLGSGIFIGKRAVVNADSRIEDGVILNTASVIEHGCIIEKFVHVAPSSVLCGNVTIGEDTHIGAGSVIKQGIKIGGNTIVGMGSVVINDINDNTVAYGNPCREVKR